jgi:hypothetical protein
MSHTDTASLSIKLNDIDTDPVAIANDTLSSRRGILTSSQRTVDTATPSCSAPMREIATSVVVS